MKADLTLAEFREAQKECDRALNAALDDFRKKTGCIVTHVQSHDTRGAQSILNCEITF